MQFMVVWSLICADLNASNSEKKRLIRVKYDINVPFYHFKIKTNQILNQILEIKIMGFAINDC